jgi:hypothetical protein
MSWSSRSQLFCVLKLRNSGAPHPNQAQAIEVSVQFRIRLDNRSSAVHENVAAVQQAGKIAQTWVPCRLEFPSTVREERAAADRNVSDNLRWI